MKERIMKYFFSLLLIILICVGCKTSDDSTSKEKKDGRIIVNINASAQAGGRTLYVKLYDVTVNIYNPFVVALDSMNFKLDAGGNGNDTLAYKAVAGKIYQVAGIIDMQGSVFISPDNGDLLFTKNTTEINGNTMVSVVETDLQVYETISGEGAFTETSIGRHHVSIWHSDTRTGWTTLGWIGDVDYINFRFNGMNGAIGRVGRHYSQKRIDDLDDSETSVNAYISHSGGGTYYFGIYGWVYDNDSWDNSTIKHEFYVIENMTRSSESDPYIGTLTVDGIVYEMHRYEFGGGSYRFKAIRTTDRRLSGPVNLKPFFEYWRENGMENLYLTELTWHIELLGGNHIGSFTCWDIDIPLY